MLNANQTNLFHNKVTLIGMMGTGKSKFGRLVANNLNFNFYDIDLLIEKRFKTTIQLFFQKYGELFFRDIEKETIEKLIFKINKNNEKVIISLGGGGFDNAETRELLLNNTSVIWLNTPLNILVQRVGDGSRRPMIKGNKKNSLEKLLKKRKKFYCLCHHQLNTNELSQNQITEKIISLITYQKNKATI